MTSYQPGARVHVAGFGKGSIREARNGGRYLVEVKGRSMEVAASQLSPHDEGASATDGRRGRPSGRPTSGATAPLEPPTPARAITLDLHGRTVEQALELLEGTLNAALLADASELRVIHGRSGGRIKAAVHRRLGELPSVRTFRVDPRNAGVTIVVL